MQDNPLVTDTRVDQEQSPLSAVAWGAVLAGAATAASVWMILMILGAGLGLSSIPLWLNTDLTADSFGVTTIAWMVLSTVAASGMGGYIAGRMRTRWLGVPKDEVWFRDTAHGFLAWAVSALVTAILLTAMIGSVVSDGIEAGAQYAESTSAAELTGSAQSGQNQSQSQNRVAESQVNERVVAEQARKAAATAAIWLFIALLSGALLASVMAIVGGRQRDE